MKKMKKIQIFLIVVTIGLLLFPLAGIAQGPVDPDDVPIDGGLSLLLAAGVTYAAKKYRDGRKKNENEEPDLK
jgi:hypothetical protein